MCGKGADLLHQAHQVELGPMLCDHSVDNVAEIDPLNRYLVTSRWYALELAAMRPGEGPAACHYIPLRDRIVDGYSRIRERRGEGLHEARPTGRIKRSWRP